MLQPPPREPTGAPLFELADVTVHGEDRDRLRGVTAAVEDEGITTLVGPSGSGKSTLLRLCNRLVAPDAGAVRFRGVDLEVLDPLQLRRAVGLVLQRPVAFPGSVRDNLLAARPRAREDEALAGALARVGLERQLLDRRADELSGGELQRVCIARTLLTEPSVLLLDEPTSSLDEQSAARVEATIRGLVADGLRALWVTHSAEQAQRLGPRQLRLAEGGVLAAGGAS